MRPILLALAAFAVAAIVPDVADAQIFGRRQPQVINQFNFGGGQQQFRQQQFRHGQQFRQQNFRQQQNFHHQQQFRQQTYFVPTQQAVTVYAQPVIAVPLQQNHGCNGGLQLNSGCSTFFSY